MAINNVALQKNLQHHSFDDVFVFEINFGSGWNFLEFAAHGQRLINESEFYVQFVVLSFELWIAQRPLF